MIEFKDFDQGSSDLKGGDLWSEKEIRSIYLVMLCLCVYLLFTVCFQYMYVCRRSSSIICCLILLFAVEREPGYNIFTPAMLMIQESGYSDFTVLKTVQK